ncbi:MAG: YidH family protein [Thermoplasmata archaeon]
MTGPTAPSLPLLPEPAAPTGGAGTGPAGSARDQLANERTFLAWVRTAVTIMAFGFVVARFGLLLRELSGGSGTLSAPAPLSEGTGIALVLAGSVLLALAFLRFLGVRADLEAGRFRTRAGLEWALTGLLVAIGVGLAIYLFTTS